MMNQKLEGKRVIGSLRKYARVHLAATVLFGCGLSNVATADVIVFSGAITQSTQDFTGPAVNNPSLSNIADADTYQVTLTFPGLISGPGTFAGSTLVFQDSAAPATESSFGSISLLVSADGSNDDFSLLGCLTSGSDCALGNQLDANFAIPAALLHGKSVAANGVDQPHPLDLLEDDGVTDIHASITSYSYTGSQPGSYRLSGNLSVPADTGAIILSGPNITIDLNGFSITTVPNSNSSAIFSSNSTVTGITIRNGNIRGWVFPIRNPGSAPSYWALEDLLIESGLPLVAASLPLGSFARISHVTAPESSIQVICPSLVVDTVARSVSGDGTTCTFAHNATSF